MIGFGRRLVSVSPNPTGNGPPPRKTRTITRGVSLVTPWTETRHPRNEIGAPTISSSRSTMSWHPGRQRIRGASEQRLSCARVASTSMLAGVSRIFFFYFAQVTNKITGSTDSGARETCSRVESSHAFSFLFTCFHIQTQKGAYTSVSGPLRPPPDVRLPRANCSCSLRQKPASNL